MGGAYTTKTSNLKFDSTVNRRIAFGSPAKGIFHDLDGTLTDLHSIGADSYVGAYYSHNEWPECTVDRDVYSGILCPNPYAIVRLVFWGASG